MSAYESLKTAQNELFRSVNDELETEGLIAITVRSGAVHTPGKETAERKVETILADQDRAVKRLWDQQGLSAEAVGTAIAAAIALAPRFRGMEILAASVLKEIGIPAYAPD